jgi:hypothetical protein
MIKLVTYATSNMSFAREKCIQSALEFGCDSVHENDLHDDFKMLNFDIFSQPRGAGYWLWKPYLIYQAMSWMQDGDFLVYSDAGVQFVSDVRNITDRMDEDIHFFSNGWNHVHWCKADCFNTIIPGYPIEDKKQVQASNIFFRVNAKTKAFVKEWLCFCMMPGFIDDSPSLTPNHPEFREHRHDQAILTCLQIKYGYRLHWFPSSTALHLDRMGDLYGVMFLHHRRRNDEWHLQ